MHANGIDDEAKLSEQYPERARCLLSRRSNGKSVTPENFDPVKFSFTVILSLIIGGAMFYFKLDYSTAAVAVTSFAAQTGLTALVEVWLKVIFRTIQKQPTVPT